MPGSTLNLVYPVLGDPIATALGKLITMFQVIQTDLQAKIVPAEFDWISDLSAQGHSLTHLGVAGFDNTNVAGVPAGSIIYDGTDFYMVTAAGPVKVTLGGAVNVSSAGGIVGDYISTSAQVYYDSGTNQYRFFSGTAVRSDLVINDLWLEALTGGGSIKLKADDAIAAARVFTLKDQPGAGVSLLTLDASGNVAPGVTVSNAQSFSGALTMTGGVTVNTTDLSVGSNVALTGTADLKHAAQWEIPQSIAAFFNNGGSFVAGFGLIQPPGGVAQTAIFPILGLRVGDVIQQAKVRWRSSAAGNTTFEVQTMLDGVATTRSDTVTVAFGDTLYHTSTVTFATPYTVATGDTLYMKWTPPASTNTDRLAGFSVFVTH